MTKRIRTLKDINIYKAGSLIIYNKKQGKYFFDDEKGIFKIGFTPKFVSENQSMFEEVRR